MHTTSIEDFRHAHDFATHHARNERQTWIVVALTGVVMIVELVAGYITGSMALTADGWHMGSHFGALGLAGLAYVYARKHGNSEKFSFGAGKIYALAGYTNALLLGVVAVLMIVESTQRLYQPIPIDFLTALPVAVGGLLINIVSAFLLHHDHSHHKHGDHHAHVDHNLRAAYLHVLADALTSVTAIVALLTGYFLGWRTMDPIMGIVGAIVILKWGLGLCRSASRQLLDVVPSQDQADTIRKAVESIDDCRVSDLHLWEIAPGRTGCIVSLVTDAPDELDRYRRTIHEATNVHHLTIEVARCPGHDVATQPS